MERRPTSHGMISPGDDDVKAIWPFLAVEAAYILKQSVAEARRRKHLYTTPLHVADAVLTDTSGLVNRACVGLRPNAFHQLHSKRLEVLFDAALGGLFTGKLLKHDLDPPFSNSLRAVLSRAQTRQRRRPTEAVRIELRELILAVLDDPAVIRVLSEAGFRTAPIKAIIRRSLISSSAKSTADSNKESLQHGKEEDQAGERINKEVSRAVNVLLRARKRNPVLMGGSESESGMVVKELLRRLQAKEIEFELLKNVHLIHLWKEIAHKGYSSRILYLDQIIKDLGGNLYPDGVIIDLGDLKWLLEEDPMVSAEVDTPTVDTIGTRLRWLRAGMCSRIWLIGTASCETYSRCQACHPTVEDAWDLHAILPTGCGLVRSGHEGKLIANQVSGKRPENQQTVASGYEKFQLMFLEKKRMAKKQMCSKMMDQEGVHLQRGPRSRFSTEAHDQVMSSPGETSSDRWNLFLHDGSTRLHTPEFLPKALSSNWYYSHNLVHLIMHSCTNYNAVEQLQNGRFFQHLLNLKLVDLRDSSLSRFPETSAGQKLEILNLSGCVNLIDVLSIHRLCKLQDVNLRGCIRVRRLPSLCNLRLVKTLDLSNCSRLDKLPRSIGHLCGLVSLNLTNCVKLEQLPGSIFKLKSLDTFSIAGCSTLMRRFAIREEPSTCGNGSKISSEMIVEESEVHLEKKIQNRFQPFHPYLESQAMEIEATEILTTPQQQQHLEKQSEPICHLPSGVNISKFIHSETKKQLGVTKLRNSFKTRTSVKFLMASPKDFREAVLSFAAGSRFIPSEPGFYSTLVEKKKETLRAYLSMSLEDIHQQQNGFLNLETIVHTLLMKHRSNVIIDEHIAPTGFKYSLAEVSRIVPDAVMSMENAEAERAVLVEKMMELDGKLVQGQQKLASVEAEFSRISEEEEDLEAQIQCLIAKKRQIMSL